MAFGINLDEAKSYQNWKTKVGCFPGSIFTARGLFSGVMRIFIPESKPASHPLFPEPLRSLPTDSFHLLRSHPRHNTSQLLRPHWPLAPALYPICFSREHFQSLWQALSVLGSPEDFSPHPNSNVSTLPRLSLKLWDKMWARQQFLKLPGGPNMQPGLNLTFYGLVNRLPIVHSRKSKLLIFISTKHLRWGHSKPQYLRMWLQMEVSSLQMSSSLHFQKQWPNFHPTLSCAHTTSEKECFICAMFSTQSLFQTLKLGE